jgi:4-alpha-glucanotransferase
MVQMQDVLGLGSEARMNTPGTVGPQNWSWRMESGEFTPELAKRLRESTKASHRLPSP